jgi:hypothetical protein
MKIIASIKHLSSFSPKVIIAKIWNRLLQRKRLNRLFALYHRSEIRHENKAIVTSLFPVIDIPSKSLETLKSSLTFDLLGSGPIRNTYHEEALGLENFKYPNQFPTKQIDSEGKFLQHIVLPIHLDFSLKCWKLIQEINPNYQALDWQRDFKSGFRWDAKQWFFSQRKIVPVGKGVDLKVPWELSRLQHLPKLALGLNTQTDQNFVTQNYILCQLLDFVMANPIGMGVNFNCPMDIGIRNANVLLTLDWLKNKNSLPSNVESIVCNYVAASTFHVLEDIEYREGLTSNHYLGNVLGILFAGAYIPHHEESDKWLAFGIQELERSMDRQFFADGSNFEGSTSYHRLSGEMMVWGAGLIACLPQSRLESLKNYSNKNWNYVAPLYSAKSQKFLSGDYVLSESFWTKLVKAGAFAEIIARPNANSIQFGDNDSGRFIKITAFGNTISSEIALKKYRNLHARLLQEESIYWEENDLHHGGFVSAVCGLIKQLPSQKNLFAHAEYNLFAEVVRKRGSLSEFLQKIDRRLNFKTKEHGDVNNLPFTQTRHFDFPNIMLQSSLKLNYFEDFQLLVFRGENIFLSLAGISNPKQHHSFGHTHSDKLGISLQVDEEDILVNPGTYLYTPIPSRRIEFRTIKSHNTVSVNGEEQNTPLSGSMGLFNVKNETRFNLVFATNNSVVAEITYRDIIHRRKVEIKDHQVVIQDWCNKEFIQNWNNGNPYSNGYGKRVAT